MMKTIYALILFPLVALADYGNTNTCEFAEQLPVSLVIGTRFIQQPSSVDYVAAGWTNLVMDRSGFVCETNRFRAKTQQELDAEAAAQEAAAAIDAYNSTPEAIAA